MDRSEFANELLDIMEAKEHWAWPLFTSGRVDADRLHIHLEQEYATYIRDFAVLLGRAYVQCPIAVARCELAENLFEEETGGIAAGRPHAELFLEYPRGLGMDLERFENVEMLDGARSYRDSLDRMTLDQGWEVGAAITTLFLEGTKWERGEIDASSPKRPEPPLESHPLVVHYGLPVEHLALTKAHRKVEGCHRKAAWSVVLDHVPAQSRPSVVTAMRECLDQWLSYRDDVAATCGLHRSDAAN